MSEVVPMPAGAEIAARRSLKRRKTGPRHAVSFSDLTRLHHSRISSLREDGTAPHAVEERYHSALASFEHDQGVIVAGYWCTTVESAVVLLA